jgi:hypothetical protein
MRFRDCFEKTVSHEYYAIWQLPFNITWTKENSVIKRDNPVRLSSDTVRLQALYRKVSLIVSNVAGTAPAISKSLFRRCSNVWTGFPRANADLASFNEALPSGADKTKSAFANSTTNSFRRMEASLVIRFTLGLQ